MSMEDLLSMQAMFGAAIIGAGIVGMMAIFAPRLAGRFVFLGDTDVGPHLQILGALWLALGIVAFLGLFNPSVYWPVLLIQLIYKSVWLLFVSIPMILRGHRDSGLIFLTALFGLWVFLLAWLVPFAKLLP